MAACEACVERSEESGLILFDYEVNEQVSTFWILLRVVSEDPLSAPEEPSPPGC